MVSERIERDLLLEVFNSFPLDEDLPIPLYLQNKSVGIHYATYMILWLNISYLIFDQPKNKDELTRASVRKFKEQGHL